MSPLKTELEAEGVLLYRNCLHFADVFTQWEMKKKIMEKKLKKKTHKNEQFKRNITKEKKNNNKNAHIYQRNLQIVSHDMCV